MALFTDNFTGTAGQALDLRSGWTKYGSGFGAGVPTINASNQLRTSTTNPDDSAFYGQEQGSADHYVQFTALSQFPWTSGYRTMVCIRAVDRNDLWAVSYHNSDGAWELMRGTTRVDSYTTAFVAGTVVKLQAVGNDIKVFLDGVERIATTSTTYNTNLRTGVVLMNATARDPVIDDYESDVMGGADTTAPTLTSAALDAISPTALNGSVTTDEAGPAWAVITTSATTPTDTQIKAGQDHTGSAAVDSDTATLAIGANADVFAFTGVASTTYYMHVVQDDTAGSPNTATPISSAGETTPTPDIDEPNLSSPVGTVRSNSLIVIGATTDEANGTMYVVVTTSSTPPSAAQVKAGQNNGGTAAVFAANQSIGSTGAKTFNATGLTQLTGYYPYIVHTDASGNDSSVLSIGLRTTFRNGATGQSVVDDTAAIPGVQEQGFLYNDVTLPADADKWFSYTIATPAVDSASLTLYANGSFIWVGGSDSFTYQLEVDGSNVGSPALVTLTASGADVTAPTLSSATGTKTGATTATGTVTTNEGNGTLYYLTNTSSSALSAAVLAGSSQAVSGTGVQNISRTGLTASTTYYHHYLHKDAAGNDSTVLSSAGFTTDPPPDVTAPTLSSPTGTKTGSTTATGTVSTNESGGTLYHLVNTSASATGAAVKAGASQAVSSSGVQNVSRTGLTPSTVYYLHYLHSDAAGNDSAVASSASFTTDAAADTTAPTLTSPTGAAFGSTGSSGSVSTNEANGTLYWLTNTSATATDAAIKAASSQAVTATGVQLVSSSGLTASTVYYNHFLHRDAAGNDSARSTSASFTTAAAPSGGGPKGSVVVAQIAKPICRPIVRPMT